MILSSDFQTEHWRGKKKSNAQRGTQAKSKLQFLHDAKESEQACRHSVRDPQCEYFIMLVASIPATKGVLAPQESDIIKEDVFQTMTRNESLCGFNSRASLCVLNGALLFSSCFRASSNIPTKYPTLEQTLDSSAVVACCARAKWSESPTGGCKWCYGIAHFHLFTAQFLPFKTKPFQKIQTMAP